MQVIQAITVQNLKGLQSIHLPMINVQKILNIGCFGKLKRISFTVDARFDDINWNYFPKLNTIQIYGIERIDEHTSILSCSDPTRLWTGLLPIAKQLNTLDIISDPIMLCGLRKGLHEFCFFWHCFFFFFCLLACFFWLFYFAFLFFLACFFGLFCFAFLFWRGFCFWETSCFIRMFVCYVCLVVYFLFLCFCNQRGVLYCTLTPTECDWVVTSTHCKRVRKPNNHTTHQPWNIKRKKKKMKGHLKIFWQRANTWILWELHRLYLWIDFTL